MGEHPGTVRFCTPRSPPSQPQHLEKLVLRHNLKKERARHARKKTADRHRKKTRGGCIKQLALASRGSRSATDLGLEDLLPAGDAGVAEEGIEVLRFPQRFHQRHCARRQREGGTRAIVRWKEKAEEGRGRRGWRGASLLCPPSCCCCCCCARVIDRPRAAWAAEHLRPWGWVGKCRHANRQTTFYLQLVLLFCCDACCTTTPVLRPRREAAREEETSRETQNQCRLGRLRVARGTSAAALRLQRSHRLRSAERPASSPQRRLRGG